MAAYSSLSSPGACCGRASSWCFSRRCLSALTDCRSAVAAAATEGAPAGNPLAASPPAPRHVRGGTERYYQRAARGLTYDDAATTEVAFRALAAEIAAAEPDPFLVLRTLRLTREHARQLIATLRDLAAVAEDASD